MLLIGSVLGISCSSVCSSVTVRNLRWGRWHGGGGCRGRSSCGWHGGGGCRGRSSCGGGSGGCVSLVVGFPEQAVGPFDRTGFLAMQHSQASLSPSS